MYPRCCKHCGRAFYAPDEFFEYCTDRCRILDQTHWEGDCLVYDGKQTTGMLTTVKYGQTKKRRLPIDVLIYESETGKRLGKGEWIDHTCGNPRCLNVKHMRVER